MNVRHVLLVPTIAFALIVVAAPLLSGCDVYDQPPSDNDTQQRPDGCEDRDGGPASSGAADGGLSADAGPVVGSCPNDCAEPEGACWGCADGVCAYAPYPNGTPCDDGDPCTVGGACQDGVCVSARVICLSPARL